MKLNGRLHRVTMLIHVTATVLGTGTIVGLAAYSVLHGGAAFDASGFGMGLGAIIGGSGIGAFGIGTVASMATPMMEGGSGHGKIEGG
jgi:hypothetical protein